MGILVHLQFTGILIMFKPFISSDAFLGSAGNNPFAGQSKETRKSDALKSLAIAVNCTAIIFNVPIIIKGFDL
ncbi:MAG: hypothetical protein Q4G69_07805 [Planctomycetia bacterium]|nr:hypothetical protein [Planctomycetia bacterium]